MTFYEKFALKEQLEDMFIIIIQVLKLMNYLDMLDILINTIIKRRKLSMLKECWEEHFLIIKNM